MSGERKGVLIREASLYQWCLYNYKEGFFCTETSDKGPSEIGMTFKQRTLDYLTSEIHRDDLSTGDKIVDPIVSPVQRFHCSWLPRVHCSMHSRHGLWTYHQSYLFGSFMVHAWSVCVHYTVCCYCSKKCWGVEISFTMLGIPLGRVNTHPVLFIPGSSHVMLYFVISPTGRVTDK